MSEVCVIDTNVPKNANLAVASHPIPDDLEACVEACVDAIEHVIKSGCLVIDSDDEIFNEYLRNLSLSGSPGLGNSFMKWVHDHRFGNQSVETITINKEGSSYTEFPDDVRLSEFDNDDRKFIAVSCAHTSNPPILQATDSQWWVYRTILAENGVEVHFLCEEYVVAKNQTQE